MGVVWPEPPEPPRTPWIAVAAATALALGLAFVVLSLPVLLGPEQARDGMADAGDAAEGAGGVTSGSVGDLGPDGLADDPGAGRAAADEGNATSGAGTDDPGAAAEPAPSPTEAPVAPTDDRELGVPGHGEHDRTFNWAFEGEDWSFHVAIPDDVYQQYRARERPLRLIEDDGLVRMHAYDLYVSEPSDDAFVEALAVALADAAAGRGWDNATRADFILSFVQSLPYTRDNVTSSFDEYPRFPVETLVDEGGDCEDTTILLGALLAALGHDIVLLAPPGHMGLGIGGLVRDAPVYTYNNATFHYAETTGEGWRVGTVPPDFANETLQVFDTVPKPLLEADLQVLDFYGSKQHFALDAVNIGTAAARDVWLSASLQRADGQVFDRRGCREPLLAPGAALDCEVWLDLSSVPRGVEVRLYVEVEDDTWLHDRLMSAAWVPRP